MIGKETYSRIGQQRADPRGHCSKPPGAPGLRIADGAEIACQHSPSGQLLGGETSLGRHDERLDEAFADRFAEEQVAGLGDDRHRDSDPIEKRRGVHTGCDHHVMALEAAAVGQGSAPAVRDRREEVGCADRQLAAQAPHRSGKRLDDCLRLVEVPILGAERRPGHPVDAKSGNDFGGLGG